PDITSITGNGTFTTKDIFGQNVTMADAGSYTILIEDRPDATPGTPVSIETGTGDRSGHDYLLITNTDYDLSAHGFTDISSPLDAHGIVMENDASGESGYDLATDGVFAWSQFELDSRDDNLSTFRMIVDNPDELFETEGVVRSDILFDPPANDTGTTFTVTLVHDDQTNTAYYEFTPVDDAVGMSAVDVDSYINSLTIDTLGEDPTPTKLTFSYTWTDVDGNFDQSIDGYQGDKPGSDADFGRTVVLIMPINDMPNPIIPPGADPDLPEDHVGFAIEEAGYILPFKDFTLTDADSTPGGIKLTMQNGWVEGDRYIEPTELSANNPKFDIAVDQTTGEVTITIKSGQTAETADYQAAVNGIQIKVADNQPDLTDIVGI
ncbi:MAG: hypothetical protein GY697_16310, partial [Desulfobacterales bacterium]|nr:hypothetical protein [Desulfobacterales bacterium]